MTDPLWPKCCVNCQKNVYFFWILHSMRIKTSQGDYKKSSTENSRKIEAHADNVEGV